MEHPHALLMLVLRQHYHNRLHIIDSAKKVISDYCEDKKANYEKTLGVLYQMMNDLPPDILLYFLTMVPLPKGPLTTTSTLIELMKQMHSSNLLNNMRPTLLQYLNNQVPPLVPIKKANIANKENVNELEGNKVKANEKGSHDNTNNLEVGEKILTSPTVHSVIDDNIKRDKSKGKKRAKPKSKAAQKKVYQVKSLALLCALNINKYDRYYQKKYEKKRKDAWDMVNNKNLHKNALLQCYTVIRDINKKMKWLSMVKTGDVSLEIIRDEYGSSDVFYQEKQLQNTVAEDVLNLNDTLKDNIDIFLSKC